jgi:hypothetical protein
LTRRALERTVEVMAMLFLIGLFALIGFSVWLVLRR